MKKIKRTLLSTLKNELFINVNKLQSNESIANYIALNQMEFNLLLNYVEDNLQMEIADEKVNINQNIDEFVQTIYALKSENRPQYK